MIRRPPRSTLFPTRRSSDLPVAVQAEAAADSPVVIQPAGHGLVRKERHRLAQPPVRRGQHETDRGLIAELPARSEEHTSELQSRLHLVCRLLLEKKKKKKKR